MRRYEEAGFSRPVQKRAPAAGRSRAGGRDPLGGCGHRRSDSASAAWAALRAASPLAALKWELGDLWADDDLSPAAVMTLGESPLLCPPGRLWRSCGPPSGRRNPVRTREETVTEPVEETPLETTGETDNGVPARTLVPTDPSGYTVCGRSYISNSTDHALTVTELSEPFDARLADGEPQILILHTHGSEAYHPTPRARTSSGPATTALRTPATTWWGWETRWRRCSPPPGSPSSMTGHCTTTRRTTTL